MAEAMEPGASVSQLRVASAYTHHNYSAGVVMLAPDKRALRCLRLSRRVWGRFVRGR